MTRKVAGLIQFFWPGRRSSVVERRTRNAQVIGSSPIAGSSEVAEGSVVWAPPPLRWFLVDRTDDLRGERGSVSSPRLVKGAASARVSTGVGANCLASDRGE